VLWRLPTSGFGTVFPVDESRPEEEHTVSTTDRRTGRERIHVVTTGLAVTGALGVVGVSGGLALHHQSATTAGATQAPSQSGSSTTSGTTPGPRKRANHHSRKPSGVTSSSGATHARSNGS
jgi:hypothetical protein